MASFTVTENHLKLIRQLEFENDGSCGAPSIDYKRPYGNSDVYRDIAKTIGMKCDQEFTDQQIGEMNRLNKQVVTALRICIATGAFVAGHYSGTSFYPSDWKLIQKL